MRQLKLFRWVAALTLAIALAPARAFAAASLTPLGGLHSGGIYSQAFGVSGDGSVVVGLSGPYPGNEAFRWTSDGGMVGLGHLPGGSSTYSEAQGVSDDGSVVVGGSTSASGNEAFRWTSDGGMVGLGALPGGPFGSTSWALGVSDDGSVVVGNSASTTPDSLSRSQAFRWTSDGGMVGLGDLPDLPSLPRDVLFTVASGVNGDGSVVVGQIYYYDSATEAFRWTSGGGMVGLGDLPGGSFSIGARSVSGDGSVVVGSSVPFTLFPDQRAIYWTADGGMRALWDVLLSHGVDPAADGWTELGSAEDISADGNTIVGYGTRNGDTDRVEVKPLRSDNYLFRPRPAAQSHW